MENILEKTIVLGGGCFWCLEALYQKVEGITSITSGYAGGSVPSPTHENVCSGSTGHAEVVRLTYDSKKLTLETIIQLFFEIHDPTTMNAQGNDIGTQYRSVIFYADAEEKSLIEKVRDEAQKNYSAKIVTEIRPLPEFYPAESYHQNYYRNHPDQPYCVAVISPKLQKFLKNHPV